MQTVSSTPLQVLVFGAGAIGTYIGGSLVLTGQRVVFLERPELVAPLQQSGLRLQMAGQEFYVPSPVVVADIHQALAQGPLDVAIFALKSFDTRLALENLRSVAAGLPPFLCLQNGVENEMALASLLGDERVIAGTVTSAVGRRGLGSIVLERLRGVGLAAAHPLAGRLAANFNQAGLNAGLYPDAVAMKWSKMLTNLLSNASSAILDWTPAQVFAHPGLYRLEIRQLNEALTVMRALNLQPVDLPHTSVRLLAWAVRFLPLWLSRPFLQRAVGSGRGGKMPSFHIDLYGGRGQSEVDDLNGAVVRYGTRLGIPTPVNALLNQTLLDLSAGRCPLDTYAHQPEKLLDRLADE